MFHVDLAVAAIASGLHVSVIGVLMDATTDPSAGLTKTIGLPLYNFRMLIIFIISMGLLFKLAESHRGEGFGKLVMEAAGIFMLLLGLTEFFARESHIIA
jgi:hypothetical protein